MPDAADRIRTEPARPRAKAAAPAPARNWARALKPKSKRTVAGAALGAVMIGIVVNAVALQHGRRVAPAPDPGPLAAVAPAPPPPAAAPEPSRPSPSPTPVAAAHAPKSADAIADLLKVQGGDKRKLTLAAQNALAKLGFDVTPTGTIDSDTRDALHKFAKKHGLPASAEITPKLIKTLNAAVAAN